MLGVYLTDHPTWVEHVSAALSASSDWLVVQRWAALGRRDIPAALEPITPWRSESLVPKFQAINHLAAQADLERAAWTVICDDDIALPARFLDEYLALSERYDFALAQPARTPESYIDHPFVAQLAGITARQTRFVEIGPLFSIRRDAVRLLVPFDETSPMGWGYDAVWPCTMADAGLRMGIVDATPVSHSFRRPVSCYDREAAEGQMRTYLRGRAHLLPGQAFRILESYV